MILEVDGQNILPYIDAKGIKWGRNDLDGEDAGRTLDGVMHRDRVSSKVRLDITCKPLTTEQSRTLLQLIYPEYVKVRYTDPMRGDVTKTMYSNNVPATIARIAEDGSPLWEGIAFPLIER